MPEHVNTNPFDDIEYFRQLYDNNIFTPLDVEVEEEAGAHDDGVLPQ